MATRIDCTFGGKAGYRPGPNSFELGLGVAPSRGSFTMKQTDLEALTLLNTAHELVIDDSTRKLRIRDLYITSTDTTAPVRAGENMVTIRFEDKRSFFKFRNVSGVFNKLEEDGTSFRAGTVKGVTPFTFDQLIEIPLRALGVNLKPATGIAWIPENVEWQLAPASAALEALLSEVGWDLALKPDGSFQLIDLRLGGGAAFSVPSGLTLLSRVKQRRDVAHERPAKAKIGFRIVRRKFTDQWEPVLQDDGDKRSKGGDNPATSTPPRATWRRAETVIAEWGSSLAAINSGWYAKLDPQAQGKIVDQLGGGDLGASRWRLIKAQLYRYWRYNDTDRPTVLPLLPVGASQNDDPGHITATGSWCFLANWHVQRRDNAGMKADFYKKRSGAPPWQVTIKDAKDGVIGFVGGAGPLAHTTKLPGKTGAGAHDFGLEKPKKGPSVLIAFYKKVVAVFTGSPTSPLAPGPTSPAVILSEADYFFVEKAGSGGPNNGETKTFLADHTVLFQTFDSGTGSFQADNQAKVTTWANAFLDAWFRQFDVPDPEEVALAGVDPAAKLDSVARAIAWDWSNGVTSRYRLNSDRSLDRFGLGRKAREKSKAISIAAESEVLVRQSGFGGAVSPTSPSAPSGPFGGTPPALVDYVPERGVPGNWFEHSPHFLNDELAGLLVAEDWRMGTSGKTCRGTQTTGGGTSGPDGRPTQTTGGGFTPKVTRPTVVTWGGNGIALYGGG